MEDKTNISTGQTVNMVIGAIAFIVIVFLVLTKVDKALKIVAVDQCMRSSKYEKVLKAEDAKVSYPLTDFYKSCLKDKGY